MLWCLCFQIVPYQIIASKMWWSSHRWRDQLEHNGNEEIGFCVTIYYPIKTHSHSNWLATANFHGIQFTHVFFFCTFSAVLRISNEEKFFTLKVQSSFDWMFALIFFRIFNLHAAYKIQYNFRWSRNVPRILAINAWLLLSIWMRTRTFTNKHTLASVIRSPPSIWNLITERNASSSQKKRVYGKCSVSISCVRCERSILDMINK